MKTTLNKIRAYSPCIEGWEKLLKHLDKTNADDAELSIATIIDSNGLSDALWCLRATDGHDKEIRLFAVWCARQVQHWMQDQRSIDALDVAERFANSEATLDELAIAYADAYEAYADAYDADARAAAAAAANAASIDYDASAAAAAAYSAASEDYAADASAAYSAAIKDFRAKRESKLRELCDQGDCQA